MRSPASQPPRRCKILCTLGPASSSPEVIGALIDAGMNACRLNLSHGSKEVHTKTYRTIRQEASRRGMAVAILADLQGPKLRVGKIPGEGFMLEAGHKLRISTNPEDAVVQEGTTAAVTTTYERLTEDVRSGDRILLDDGNIELTANGADGHVLNTTVVQGGLLSSNKGINLPGVELPVPALTEKDREDLEFALELGVDVVALSFVRKPEDLEVARDVMRKMGRMRPLIAKIEKPQAIDNLAEIVDDFDGVMVARGDLGVECPLEDVPFLQKQVIDVARRRAKPVIVATQMLESMIAAPAPTRAEASDVANAILDGADAVMLSGETSVGKYPIESIQTMARIISSTDDHGLVGMAAIDWQPKTRGGVIAKAAAEVAERVAAKYLVAFTQSGDSARRLARLRGTTPILAFTTEDATRSQLSMSWGVETFKMADVEHTDEMVRQVDEALLEIGRVKEGDLVVIIAGSPPGIPGSTNALRIHRMGDAINQAAPAYRRA